MNHSIFRRHISRNTMCHTTMTCHYTRKMNTLSTVLAHLDFHPQKALNTMQLLLSFFPCDDGFGNISARCHSSFFPCVSTRSGIGIGPTPSTRLAPSTRLISRRLCLQTSQNLSTLRRKGNDNDSKMRTRRIGKDIIGAERVFA